MFMERIEVPADEARKPKPKGVKLAAGATFLPIAALIWVPWLCVTAMWFLVAGTLRAAAKIGATIRDTLLYAGELVVGR
jgi:hypothetical protein